MADEQGREELDRAFETAVRRTADAQAHVDEVLDKGVIPPIPVVDDVVRRAEDVRELAAALDGGDPGAEGPESEDRAG